MLWCWNIVNENILKFWKKDSIVDDKINDVYRCRAWIQDRPGGWKAFNRAGIEQIAILRYD